MEGIVAICFTLNPFSQEKYVVYQLLSKGIKRKSYTGVTLLYLEDCTPYISCCWWRSLQAIREQFAEGTHYHAQTVLQMAHVNELLAS